SREIEHSGVKEQASLLRADEISCHGRHPIKLTVGPALWRRFCPRQSPFRSSHGGIRPWGPPIPRLKRHKRPDHRHRRLLRARRKRPRRRRAAECDQQFPLSDGDCHTPLPCEVRKGTIARRERAVPNSAAPGAGEAGSAALNVLGTPRDEWALATPTASRG